MKYIIIFFLASTFVFNNVYGQEDAISKYFEQYYESEDFTSVYISPKMFQMLGKIDTDNMDDDEAKEVLEVISDLRGLRILTTEKNPRELYKEALQKINTKGYEVLMTVRDENENVQFLVKDEGNVINELLLVVGSPDEFVLISFVGNIDLDKIGKLSKSIDIKGADHLKALEER